MQHLHAMFFLHVVDAVVSDLVNDQVNVGEEDVVDPVTVVSITLPPTLFEREEVIDDEVGLAFTFYESANLFPLANGTNSDAAIGSSVIGALIAGKDVLNLQDPVEIVLPLLNDVSFCSNDNK